jgi:hypothetical protein
MEQITDFEERDYSLKEKLSILTYNLLSRCRCPWLDVSYYLQFTPSKRNKRERSWQIIRIALQFPTRVVSLSNSRLAKCIKLANLHNLWFQVKMKSESSACSNIPTSLKKFPDSKMKLVNKFYLLGVQCDLKRSQFVREITLLKVYDCISLFLWIKPFK